MEVRSSSQLVNERGLHARPCHAIVTTALSFSSTLRIACGTQEVDGKSMLELLTLCAAQGATLEFRAVGEDAHELVSQLQALTARGFEEVS